MGDLRNAAREALAFFEVCDDDNAGRVADMLRAGLDRGSRIDPLWVVTEPTPASTVPDICFRATLHELRLQVLGGLDVEHAALFTDEDDAVEEAKHRLLALRVAADIRKHRGAAPDEVVRVTIHGEDGRVIYEGDVR